MVLNANADKLDMIDSSTTFEDMECLNTTLGISGQLNEEVMSCAEILTDDRFVQLQTLKVFTGSRLMNEEARSQIVMRIIVLRNTEKHRA